MADTPHPPAPKVRAPLLLKLALLACVLAVVPLGVVGFLFTITAASSCLTVLRGVRPETARDAKSPLEVFMHKHGTALLTGQLAVLAVATVGAVALDEYRSRKKQP
jgi:hypothetical protein